MARRQEEQEQGNFFNREELHQYFGDRYSPEQVNKALQILAENSEANFDPHGNKFSVDITSALEEVFAAVGAALEAQKTLESPSEQITKLEQGGIYSQHSNPALVAAVARMIVEEGIREGTALVNLKSKVIGQVLEQGDLTIARSIKERGNGTSGFLQALANDTQKINTMLSGYGVDVIDVDAFLDEVRSDAGAVKESVRAIAPTPKTFDVDAFLLEAGKE